MNSSEPSPNLNQNNMYYVGITIVVIKNKKNK